MEDISNFCLDKISKQFYDRRSLMRNTYYMEYMEYRVVF